MPHACTSLAPSWWNYTGVKLAKLAISVSEKVMDCRLSDCGLGGYDGSKPSYISFLSSSRVDREIERLETPRSRRCRTFLEYRLLPHIFSRFAIR